MRFHSLTLTILVSSMNIISSFLTQPILKSSVSSRILNRSFSTALEMTKVGLCQFPVSEDKLRNHEMASKYLKLASQEGCKLAVLPEIWNGPYATAAFPEYAEVLPSVDGNSVGDSASARLLQQHASDLKLWVVGGSISEKEDGKIYNTCLVFDPSGKLVAKHRKAHLFDIDVPGGITFRESDTLSPGESLTAFDGGEEFGMVGIGICYDIRFPEYSLLLNKKYKCNLLIYPGAFNLTTGPAHWELLQRARAVDNQCYVLTASPARVEEPKTQGKYPHYTAWGHSTVVAPWGDILATTDESESLVVAELDLPKVQSMRQSIPTFKQKRDDLYRLEEP
mmetsp:Transcript_27685/g.31627  ORF Transcript_27685/g.31627 Transcript_27685/m.31627 type:complete len:337 (-) Transcript_27685:90-1100(-)